VKRIALAVLLASCADDTTPEWQLDHERVVAVRVSPPHIVFGEIAQIGALVAHEGRATEEVSPVGASAPFAPAGLFTAVHFNLDHWELDGAPPEQLAQARAELGLADDDPVPVAVTLQFPGRLYAEKIVWLGDSRANPDVATVLVDGAELADDLRLAGEAQAALVIEVNDGDRVRWLTSCGALDEHDSPRATLRVDARCDGELVVVVRDMFGGTAWRVWPLHVQ
jgi:hypothetical protein